jgi:hypothetical protein
MTTYEEFLAAIGMTEGEFAPFNTGPLPLNIPGILPDIRPPRQVQYEVYDEIVRQMDKLVRYAIKNYPDDISLPFKIMARAEKLVTSYVDEDFDDLIPFQQRIRQCLRTRWRMERRRFVRIALLRPDLPSFDEELKENRWGQPEDIAEDYKAAELCVKEGAWLLEGLRPPPPNRRRVS